MLRVSNIAKSFDRREILHDVSFSLENSDVLIVTGKNGSGKTTLLNVLSGLISADSGNAQCEDVKLKQAERWKEKTAFVAHELMFAENQTVEFTMNFYHKFFSINDKRFTEFTNVFKINELKGKQIGELSTGEVRRLSMSLCFMRNARLQLFDEPLVNLDENFRSRFLEVLKNSVPQRKTIIATHNLQAFIDLAPKFSILKKGHLYQPNSSGFSDYQNILEIISDELSK